MGNMSKKPFRDKDTGLLSEPESTHTLSGTFAKTAMVSAQAIGGEPPNAKFPAGSQIPESPCIISVNMPSVKAAPFGLSSGLHKDERERPA